jgi:hypothetical protein
MTEAGDEPGGGGWRRRRGHVSRADELDAALRRAGVELGDLVLEPQGGMRRGDHVLYDRYGNRTVVLREELATSDSTWMALLFADDAANGAGTPAQTVTGATTEIAAQAATWLNTANDSGEPAPPLRFLTGQLAEVAAVLQTDAVDRMSSEFEHLQRLLVRTHLENQRLIEHLGLPPVTDDEVDAATPKVVGEVPGRGR